MGGGFFVQAADGIRALVRSRGLGDVYKRQVQVRRDRLMQCVEVADDPVQQRVEMFAIGLAAVSYTHLTLPTIYSV